jgi:hypothetical protein
LLLFFEPLRVAHATRLRISTKPSGARGAWINSTAARDAGAFVAVSDAQGRFAGQVEKP